ncbi:MAG: YraN family protein [Planctomycetaceae bacterium]
MPGWWRKLFGAGGERHAARFLKQLGYKILNRGYASRLGEIDLVALDGNCIVFVEVKTRRSTAAGRGDEAITFDKQKRLTRAALAYLKRHRRLEQSARFDVISILWPDGVREPEITHYKNAFEPTGFGQMFS